MEEKEEKVIISFFQIDSHKSNGLCKVTSNLKSFT